MWQYEKGVHLLFHYLLKKPVTRKLTIRYIFVDYICENHVKNISCVGGKIQIKEDIFGRREVEHCPDGSIFFCIINVTDKIRKNCEGKESCVVVSSKEYLKIRFHPCFKYSKYLQIRKTCESDGKIHF